MPAGGPLPTVDCLEKSLRRLDLFVDEVSAGVGAPSNTTFLSLDVDQGILPSLGYRHEECGAFQALPSIPPGITTFSLRRREAYPHIH